jgi:hypothetical protein
MSDSVVAEQKYESSSEAESASSEYSSLEDSDSILNFVLQVSLRTALEEGKKRLSELHEQEQAMYSKLQNLDREEVLIQDIDQVREWAENGELRRNENPKWVALRMDPDWPIDHLFWQEFIKLDSEMEKEKLVLSYDSLEDMSLNSFDIDSDGDMFNVD